MAGLFDLYTSAIDTPKRMYAESLFKSLVGSKTPQTENNFSKAELQDLQKLVKSVYDKKIAYFSRPKEELLKEAVTLENQAKTYEKLKQQPPGNLSVEGLRKQAENLRNAAQGKLPTDFKVGYEDMLNVPMTYNWRDTLGQFRFKVSPEGLFNVYDAYDFNNSAHADAVKRYAEMPPVARFTSALSDFLQGKEAALGEAYLGDTSIPVNLNLTGLEPTIK